MEELKKYDGDYLEDDATETQAPQTSETPETQAPADTDTEDEPEKVKEGEDESNS